MRGASQALSCACAMEENLELTADQSLITQLLLNLTENAIKYGRDGGDVFCRARREGDQIRLTVADNGVGISPENLPQIF